MISWDRINKAADFLSQAGYTTESELLVSVARQRDRAAADAMEWFQLAKLNTKLMRAIVEWQDQREVVFMSPSEPGET